MLEELVERLRAGDRKALARLLSLAARGEQLQAISVALGAQEKKARIVAITGSTGVGKSTLVGKLAEHLRKQQITVAVLACDPQSPVTGGALLGDRLRMASKPDDEGMYIRSLAAQTGRQGIAEHLELMIRLVAVFGFQVIFLETAGAGQSDTAVCDLADVVVLLVQPESGDEIQWEKAGLWEVADVIVVHKADLPGAQRLEAEAKEQLRLGAHASEHHVVRVSSAKNEGLAELWNAITQVAHADHPSSDDDRRLLRQAQRLLEERFAQRAGEVGQVIERWRRRDLDLAQASAELLDLLAQK